MSFTVDSENVVSFRPATLHVKWDGKSDATVSFELGCYDTGASFSAVAFPVYTSAGKYSFGETTSPTVVTWIKGERRFDIGAGGVKNYVPAVTLPSTVASGIATIRFSAITATYYSHAWSLTGTKGTVTRVITAGGVFPEAQNPYSPGSFVGGVTASGCFG
jgi:hypothetical protein